MQANPANMLTVCRLSRNKNDTWGHRQAADIWAAVVVADQWVALPVAEVCTAALRVVVECRMVAVVLRVAVAECLTVVVLREEEVTLVDIIHKETKKPFRFI